MSVSQHIKMPAVAPIIRYTANGSLTNFSYPFPIFKMEDLKVYIAGVLQNSGYSVTGIGDTNGGVVQFNSPPAANTQITLLRDIKIERMSDFLESGDFSADILNTELDYIVASLQQLSEQQKSNLRFQTYESNPNLVLPDKAVRANKALGFDANGVPTTYEVSTLSIPPSFFAPGAGSVSRSLNAKLSDMISVKDFGAVGDGVADDTGAFQMALSNNLSIFVPAGTYRLTSSLSLRPNQTMMGQGQESVLQTTSTTISVIICGVANSSVSNMVIQGGLVGLRLIGQDGVCEFNRFRDITFRANRTAISVEGGSNLTRPTRKNLFENILIQDAEINGIHIRMMPSGSTPSTNMFVNIMTVNPNAALTGSGFYVEHADRGTMIANSHFHVSALAHSAIRIGSGSDRTLINQVQTESSGSAPNIRLEAGSQDTAIHQIRAFSAGPVIQDLSNGSFTLSQAGAAQADRVARLVATDISSSLQRSEFETITTSGTTNLDLSHSVHIVNAAAGAMTLNLPTASAALGAILTFKKVDNSSNIITIGEISGNGPDNSLFFLATENEFVTVHSNGVRWNIISSNRSVRSVRTITNPTATFDLDHAHEIYLINLTAIGSMVRLLPANNARVVGRTFTIKRIDAMALNLNIGVQSGTMPDQLASIVLSTRFQSITFYSDGTNWHILNRYL
jgi:hypothetical protein